MRISRLVLLLLLSSTIKVIFGQTNSNNFDKKLLNKEYTKSIATDPLLPLFNSFALVYEEVFNQKNGLIIGFWYGKVTTTYPKEIKYPGYAHNFAPILGYRRYFWRNLHAEFQLYPGYSRFFEENENNTYHSFSLFTELRVGYKFDFEIKELPFVLNLQWPVGTSLYESNEPESFKEIRKQDPVFYLFFPNIYLGFRF